MRKTFDFQQSFGNVDISQIKTDPKSRDEIDRTVLGLQFIYTNIEIRTEVFKLLEGIILPKVSKKTGRPGMELWKILVLGVMRQACSWDYDKLHHMANNNLMIRELLGHERDDWTDRYPYQLQTLKDNVSLLTPGILDKINEIVVKAGHKLLGGKKKAELRTSVDSFVLKTDVHFPSDISLLYDSMRKSIHLTATICEKYEISGWRQSDYHIRTLKNELRKVQKSKQSRKSEKIESAHREYVTKSQISLAKVKDTLAIINSTVSIDLILMAMLVELDKYISYAEHHIDLIERRVFHGETIPNSDKMFSIFETHTRWISKGKAGVPVELGVPLAIMKDQHGYILEHEIMETTTDVNIAVHLVKRAKAKYNAIKSSSFDKGFWSPSNLKELQEELEKVVLPKKGRLNKTEYAEEHSEEFIKLRRKHSAVESSINGLNHSGLEKCYDHGIDGLKRCVSLSILARNLHTLGKDIQEKEEKRRIRKKHKKAA